MDATKGPKTGKNSNKPASNASTKAFGTPIKTKPRNIKTAVIDNNNCPCSQYILIPKRSHRFTTYFLYFRGVIPLIKLETPCGCIAKKNVKTKIKRKSNKPPNMKDMPTCMFPN